MFNNIVGSISGLTSRMGPVVKIGLGVAAAFIAFKMIKGRI